MNLKRFPVNLLQLSLAGLFCLGAQSGLAQEVPPQEEATRLNRVLRVQVPAELRNRLSDYRGVLLFKEGLESREIQRVYYCHNWENSKVRANSKIKDLVIDGTCYPFSPQDFSAPGIELIPGGILRIESPGFDTVYGGEVTIRFQSKLMKKSTLNIWIGREEAQKPFSTIYFGEKKDRLFDVLVMDVNFVPPVVKRITLERDKSSLLELKVGKDY